MADTKATENAVWTDQLMHGKTDGGEEVILFPITRYENVLGSPKVVDDLDSFVGAPFFFYQADEVEVADEYVDSLLGITVASDEEESDTETV